jgi:flagellar biosynthesis protein FlhG
MNPTPPGAGFSYPSEIAPARLQFIEQSFADLLTSCAGALGRPREDVIRWVHQRVFVDHAPVGTVRLELHQHCRKTRLIAVTSGKGGVGKTTVSVNLSLAFAARGLRVLLFDADLGLANVHVFAGVNPSITLLDVMDGRATLPAAVVPGPIPGLDLICGASGIGRLADLPAQTLEAIGRELVQLASRYDLLLIDTGAGVSASVMYFLRLVQEVVLISTPNLAATLDAYGMIKLAREQRLPANFHLLLNQADDADQAAQAAARITGCALRFLQFQPKDLGFLQRDPAMEAASFARHPLVLSRPDHVNSQRLTHIAAVLLGQSALTPHTASTAAA